nr:hypothetical protein [Nocardioides sp. Iso805N]
MVEVGLHGLWRQIQDASDALVRESFSHIRKDNDLTGRELSTSHRVLPEAGGRKGIRPSSHTVAFLTPIARKFGVPDAGAARKLNSCDGTDQNSSVVDDRESEWPAGPWLRAVA